MVNILLKMLQKKLFICVYMQVLSLIGVFLFCWLPYAVLSLIGILGLAEVQWCQLSNSSFFNLMDFLKRACQFQNCPLLITVFPLQFAKTCVVLNPTILIFRNKMVSLWPTVSYNRITLSFPFSPLVRTELSKSSYHI